MMANYEIVGIDVDSEVPWYITLVYSLDSHAESPGSNPMHYIAQHFCPSARQYLSMHIAALDPGVLMRSWMWKMIMYFPMQALHHV